MKQDNSPFGLLAFLHWDHVWNRFHFPKKSLEKAVSLIKSLGSPMVRVDILWSDVMEVNEKFNFERYDVIMDLLTAANIPILAILHYNKHDVLDKKNQWNTPPESTSEFSNYVYNTVSHFKDRIHYWEIWNEPNHPNYWIKPPDNLKSYVELLKASYVSAKKADPTCLVLNGGVTEPLRDAVNDLYNNNARDYFDILNIHTFIDPLSENPLGIFDSILVDVQKIMDSNNDQNKKIWITEMGCPGLPQGVKQKWFAGEAVSEEEQADWLEKIFIHVENYPRVEKLFWAFYRDTDNEFKDGTDYLGLIRADFSPKPSYFRYQKIIKEKKLVF